MSNDNDKYITVWNIYQASNKNKSKPVNPEWEKEMKIIRRTHICVFCRKYPGDSNWMFGEKIRGSYHCFECIPIN
tara:strand:- start:319 stop:543 length:225 start_codon:yes stop_codon:yes gene_type:complete